MSRLIDADALLRDIEEYHLSDGKFQHWVEVQPTIEQPERDCILKQFGECTYKETGCSDCRIKAKIKAALSSEKSAQLERKRKWINGRCSECNAHAPFYAMASTYYESAYCPNCGADMRERKKEKEKEK